MLRTPHFGTSETPADLVDAIHEVRRRWRYKLMLRGAVGVSGSAPWCWRCPPGASSRGGSARRRSSRSACSSPPRSPSLVGWFLVRPLLRRVTDEQVALYLEEHEPSLQAEIISAVEATRLAKSDNSPHSARLVGRLVESAVRKAKRSTGPQRRALAAAALRPDLRRHRHRRHRACSRSVPPSCATRLSALLVVSRSVEAAAPYRIDVTPGNASVPRGADQTITATLGGFDAPQASLMVRKAADAPFERVPLVRSENSNEPNKFEGMLFDLAGPIDYFVEAEGVRSPTYTLKVVDLPYVQKLELEYHFPAYTGLEPRKIEDGGDIAVLQGHRGPRQGRADDDGARAGRSSLQRRWQAAAGRGRPTAR